MGFNLKGAIGGALGGFATGGPFGAIAGGLGGGLLSESGSAANNQAGAGLGALPAGATSNFLRNAQAQGLPKLQIANIRSILESKGRSDPAIMNRILAASSRATGADQAALEAREARSGIRSGIGSALSNAINAAGADREAGIRAAEAATAEDRRRGDVSLVNASLIDPILSALGVESGVAVNRAQIAAAEGDRNAQALAALLGAAAQFRRPNSSTANDRPPA